MALTTCAEITLEGTSVSDLGTGSTLDGGDSLLATLRVRSGPHVGASLPVTGVVASVGADPANNVVIAGVDVAPRHGQLRLRGGVWMFSNFGAPTATLIDGEPVHGDAVLAPGSALQLGQVQVAFAPEDRWRDSTIERYEDDPIPAAMMPVASSSIWSRVWFSLALCALLVAVYFLFRTI
jgi:hypothetical protein